MAETEQQMRERMARMRAARGRGELTPSQQADMARADAARRPVEGDETEQACETALKFVGSLAPEWAKRIEILRSERNYSASQALGSMCGYVLDRSLHLEIPPHPYLDPRNRIIGEKACEQCGVMFKPEVPGQRFHENECGFAFQRQRKTG